MRHRLGLATRTQISVCKSPFPFAGTAVSLFRAKNSSVETTVADGAQNPLLKPTVVCMSAKFGLVLSLVIVWIHFNST